jgi:Fe-S-cluster-containing dehydrogenase component
MTDDQKPTNDGSMPDPPGSPLQNRRGFLKAGVGSAAAVATAAWAAQPLGALTDGPSMSAFMRQHYTKLTPEMMERILREVEGEVAKNYGAKVRVGDPKPLDGVEFAYALNISRCNGSRRCVEACMVENNIPADQPEMAYIRVIEMPNDSLDLEEGDALYSRDQVPEPNKFYLPMSCQQCRQPPCTKVCPVHATWTEPDGITVIDYNWCIGCRCCMAACPYEARRFNWTRPQLAPEAINPDMGYLSNQPRPRGVPEKCHFCLHRTRLGKNPACMEVCPTGARVFGNVLDPDGKIQYILKNKRVYILKAEAHTFPRFYYFFDR